MSNPKKHTSLYRRVYCSGDCPRCPRNDTWPNCLEVQERDRKLRRDKYGTVK
jgi:hypothetical protein